MRSAAATKLRKWELWDRDANHKVQDLDLGEVKTVIKSIGRQRLHHWMARAEGQKEWKALWEFTELEVTPTIPSEVPNPVLGTVDDSTLEVDVIGIKDRRGSKRYKKSFEFTVYGDKVNFQTHTRDVSLEGISLRDPLPSWITDPFSAVLFKGNEKVQVKLQRVSERDARRLKLISANPIELLRQWILKW